MKASDIVLCCDWPCVDVVHHAFTVPEVNLDPNRISTIVISEAAPLDPADYYYSSAPALFAQTTVLAFQDAGAPVESMQDVLALGTYFTTAVKCGKTGYAIASKTVGACSFLLEQELALFPNVRAYLLMGDVAIKGLNTIAKRTGEGRVIPAGSTYKIRGQPYYFRGARAFPSYLQAGPSYFIEKSKRRMIAEDIAAALDVAGQRH